MDDVLSLIRLLAATSVEESPLARNRDLTEGVKREEVVREGIIPEGDAAAPAELKPPRDALGPGVKWIVPAKVKGEEAWPVPPSIQSVGPASPIPPQSVSVEGANPRTGIPVVLMPAAVKPLEPASAPPARVMAPETFLGQSATPQILRAIAGSPAEIRDRTDVQGVAYPTPKTRVTITVPPVFPVDPTEAFSRVDEELNLPPRPQTPQARQMQVSLPDESEPSEVYVGQSLADVSGSQSQRWAL